jgi:magnesium transporter
MCRKKKGSKAEAGGAGAAMPARGKHALFGRRSFNRPGTAPGTLDTAAPPDAPRAAIDVIAYGPERCEMVKVHSLDQLERLRGEHPMVWVNVSGLGDIPTVERVGANFGLHPLALEDVVHLGQRPKTEEYDDHRFIVMQLIHTATGFDAEQISLFFGKGFVITFQERPEDVFEPVRERLRKGRTRIRGMGADYLTYALIDAVVDQYFPILETFGERLEDLEEELVDRPDPDTLHLIYRAKRELLVLRRAAWPQREVINALERDDSGLVAPETKVFLRDAYDHCVQTLDILESYRELAGGMVDVYLSSLSNRMNEVMKVLTIMATIFIPLTFIAGIYGMNFDPEASHWNMPELDWAYGYPMALGVMAVIGLAMVIWFRRKRWL